MIKRTDDVWTTVQCKNLISDDGKLCNLCFKVLNDRFALTQQCPYCLGKIDLRPWVYKEGEQKPIKKQFPKVREEDTVGFQRNIERAAEDAGVLLWKESAEEHSK